MKKILFFSPYFYPYVSGLTVNPLRILSCLGKQHKITVLTFPHSPNLPNEEKFNNLLIRRMPYNFRLFKGFISLRSVSIFWDQVKKNDIIMLNLPNFEAWPLVLCSIIHKKPILSIYHCDVNLGYGIGNRFIEFFLNCSVKFQLTCSRQIVTHSKDYVDNHKSITKFKNKIKYVLPPIEISAADTRFTRQLLLYKKSGAAIMGFVGRIAREKGIEHLILAVKSLGKQQKVTVWFAGPAGTATRGEETYYRYILKLLESSQIHYRFFTKLTDHQLAALYRTIDILVLSSINQTEAFGMVQAEAMLQGTPVIATDLPGVRIPIGLTKMGLIVPPHNSEAIAQAITTIVAHRQCYTNQRLIAKARLIFDINKTYRFYHRLIRNILVN